MGEGLGERVVLASPNPAVKYWNCSCIGVSGVVTSVTAYIGYVALSPRPSPIKGEGSIGKNCFCSALRAERFENI